MKEIALRSEVSKSEKPFFNHIAGLRGLAIILVVLFHLNPNFFVHGYYGVDVFLVITGYLLFLGLNRNDGGWKDTCLFSLKKVQRLMPPVCFCVIFATIAGVYFLDAEVMAAAARTGRDSLLGLSNLQLAKSLRDYFAEESSENPLLHMWYIGVTLQVYLIFAIGNMLARRMPKALTLIFLWGFGIISCVWCYSLWIHDLFQSWELPVWSQTSHPSHYQTLPRVWEVLAGGLVFMLPGVKSRLLRIILAFLGGGMILLPALLQEDIFSSCTIIVVVGTILVIRYANQGWVSRVLTNRLILWLGSISFSLYLVHMPLFVCTKGWLYYDLTFAQNALLFTVSVMLGWGFWWTIEKRNISYKIWIPIWVLALLLSVACKNTKGFFKYVHPESNIGLLAEYKDWKFFEDLSYAKGLDKKMLAMHDGVFVIMSCPRKDYVSNSGLPFLSLGDTDTHNPNFVLLGDSHAQALVPGMDVFCRKNNLSGIFMGAIIVPFWNVECPMLDGVPTYFCNREKMMALKKWLSSQPELRYVLVSQSWFKRMLNPTVYDWDLKPVQNPSLKFYEQALREFCLNIKACGKEVVIISQTPDFDRTPARFVRWMVRRGKQKEADYGVISLSLEQYNRRYAHIISMLEKLKMEGLCQVVSPSAAISADTPFCAYQEGTLMMKDSTHLSVSGSIWLVNRLAQQLLDALTKK